MKNLFVHRKHVAPPLAAVCFCIALLAPCRMQAEGGESVAVVYNALMPESKEVADHYARQRQVPESQILGLDLPKTETMSCEDFRDGLQKPLFRWLEKQKLFIVRMDSLPLGTNKTSKTFWRVKESKIRYAVLCHGVPLKIAAGADPAGTDVSSIPEPMRRNEAAVDSELALLPLEDLKLPAIGAQNNPVFLATNAALIHPTNGVLMVARLDGPDTATAKGLVDKAILAENWGLWGRAYFDLRGLPETNEYRMGDDWIHAAAGICRQAGFETVTDENQQTFPAGMPLSHVAFYAGWYDADVSGPFAGKTVEFMPGAFAYHLHSFSAATVRDPGKHWAGPLLARGVTATLGCVNEPYLSMTPNIGAFMGRFVMGGFSFGEAAYACQPVLSWQNTVIGDPLYRPFAMKPQQLHERLAEKKSRLIEWSHLGVANLNLVQGYPLEEVLTYLQEVGKSSPVLMEKFGDLCLRQNKTWSAINAYAQALDLSPSPRQELRLLLTLADKLEQENRDEEALSMLKLLVKKMPDYPDRLPVRKRMLLLAEKTGKTAEAESLKQEIRRLSDGKE